MVDPDAELAIHITVKEAAKTLTIADTGIGMNREEMVQNLGTIAHFGRSHSSRTPEGPGRAGGDHRPVWRGLLFGLYGGGEVTVTSRSYRQEDAAAVWQSSGDSRLPSGRRRRRAGAPRSASTQGRRQGVCQHLAAGKCDQEALGLRLIPHLCAGQEGEARSPTGTRRSGASRPPAWRLLSTRSSTSS